MAEPIPLLSTEDLNGSADSALLDDDFDMTFHDPPSSPFVSHLETEDQENVAPSTKATPMKHIYKAEDSVPQSAIKVSPEKKMVLKEQAGTIATSPEKTLLSEFEKATSDASARKRTEPTGMSPLKHKTSDRFEPSDGSQERRSKSPSKSSRPSAELLAAESPHPQAEEKASTPGLPELRDNEGLTIAMKLAEDPTRKQGASGRSNSSDEDFVTDLDMERSEFNPDGPEITSVDIDDTGFSMFSEMPGLDMTKFAFLNKSSGNTERPDATPRARVPMTPSTVRRNDERSPSPTPRRLYKENDTTNLLIDFTEQIQSFSQSRRASPSKGRPSPSKSVTQPDLRSFYQNKRSPAKGGSHVPSTPSQGRQMLNLLDFELPPPPTPRSLPTVTIREMESVKSQFQSQISSLTASLSGKEAEVESLSKAIADAERRVGEAHETARDERSAREYAEAQMEDWKKKGEEVQKLLQDVQAEMARNDSEREALLTRLVEAERRAEEAETRASELETKVIEAESKNVDMTTFINNDSGEENKKIYSELECQTAIAEKVNEVARDLHTAYKAKHEKKIKALKDNYQKKADERCKELRLQIIRLERQVEEAEKKRDDTFSKVLPEGVTAKTDDSSAPSASRPDDLEKLEKQRAEIENLKAKLAGLQSELSSLRKSHDQLLEDLESERVEKGELVAAAEQMLSLCGEKMEEMQQEDLRRSTMGNPPPAVQKQAAPAGNAMRNTGFLAAAPAPRPGSALAGGRPGSAIGDRSGAGIAKPSGLRAPGGFGYQGSSALNRSTSGGKSRLLSNIERMGGGGGQE